MSVTLDEERLVLACSDFSEVAGITITSVLEPLAGPGAPVKPAVYAGGQYQLDRRWDSSSQPPEPVDVVVIDNVPSQANRLEAALELLRERAGLPEVVLDLSGVHDMPPHLPRSLSGLRFPHRQADAYLRDALLGGQAFPGTQLGRDLLASTAEDATALLQWFPQAALFGFWQSHLGKKRSQAKLARSWVSETVGYRPATTATKVLGLKGDPINLSVDEPVEFDPEDLLAEPWRIVEGAKKAGGGRARERLSELGHGQVPVNPADASPAAISFARVEQKSTVSFAGLRRVHAGAPDASAAARALLVAIGVAAHVAAFGRPFSLRSGCDLRPASADWRWVAHDREQLAPPSLDQAVDLLRACAARAESLGLPVGSKWAAEPLVLTPAGNLSAAIRSTWAVEE
jgi:CRISPR-associated protein Csb1